MHFVLSGEEADMAEGKILMVDDDKEIADLVEIHLRVRAIRFIKRIMGKKLWKYLTQKRLILLFLT